MALECPVWVHIVQVHHLILGVDGACVVLLRGVAGTKSMPRTSQRLRYLSILRYYKIKENLNYEPGIFCERVGFQKGMSASVTVVTYQQQGGLVESD